MLEIVIATRNSHKVRELATLMRLRGIRWRSLAEFPHAKAVAEPGRTFDANAIRKARAAAHATGLLALADDSGIEVEALHGGPGVRSARFAGAHGDDQANNRTLLRRLKDRPLRERGACYRCSLALASPSGVLAVTHGVWSGVIAQVSRGRGGFGYDPIFLVPRYGKTVGQMSTALKQRLSHRAQAARALRPMLKRLAAVSARRRGAVATARRMPARSV